MKTLLLTITFLACSTTINSFAATGVSMAPQIGSTSFNVTKSGLSAKSGSLVGAGLVFDSSIDGLAVETGLQYFQAGAEKNFFIAKVEYSMNYLAIPLLANWSFYRGGDSTKLYLKAGAVATQLLSAEQKTADFTGASAKTNIKDFVAKNDVLLMAGLGGQWKVMDFLNMTLDLSYAKGTTKVIKGENGYSEGLILASSLVFPL